MPPTLTGSASGGASPAEGEQGSDQGSDQADFTAGESVIRLVMPRSSGADTGTGSGTGTGSIAGGGGRRSLGTAMTAGSGTPTATGTGSVNTIPVPRPRSRFVSYSRRSSPAADGGNCALISEGQDSDADGVSEGTTHKARAGLTLEPVAATSYKAKHQQSSGVPSRDRRRASTCSSPDGVSGSGWISGSSDEGGVVWAPPEPLSAS